MFNKAHVTTTIVSSLAQGKGGNVFPRSEIQKVGVVTSNDVPRSEIQSGCGRPRPWVWPSGDPGDPLDLGCTLGCYGESPLSFIWWCDFFPALQFPWDVPWEPMPLFGQTPRKVFLHLISFYCSWAILLSFRPSDWLEGQVTT